MAFKVGHQIQKGCFSVKLHPHSENGAGEGNRTPMGLAFYPTGRSGQRNNAQLDLID
jgi:hypothetical protein